MKSMKNLFKKKSAFPEDQKVELLEKKGPSQPVDTENLSQNRPSNKSISQRESSSSSSKRKKKKPQPSTPCLPCLVVTLIIVSTPHS